MVINRHHHEHRCKYSLLHTGKVFSPTQCKLGFCFSIPCSSTAAFSTIPFCTVPKSISWRQPLSKAGARPLGWPKPWEVPLTGDLPAFPQITRATILQDGAGACNTFDTTCSLWISLSFKKKVNHSLYAHFCRIQHPEERLLLSLNTPHCWGRLDTARWGWQTSLGTLQSPQTSPKTNDKAPQPSCSVSWDQRGGCLTWALLLWL